MLARCVQLEGPAPGKGAWDLPSLQLTHVWPGARRRPSQVLSPTVFLTLQAQGNLVAVSALSLSHPSEAVEARHCSDFRVFSCPHTRENGVPQRPAPPQPASRAEHQRGSARNLQDLQRAAGGGLP